MSSISQVDRSPTIQTASTTGCCSYLTEKVKNIWETTKDLIIAFFQSILHCRNYLYLPFTQSKSINGELLYTYLDSDNWGSAYLLTKLDKEFSAISKPEERKEYFLQLLQGCIVKDRKNGTFRTFELIAKLQQRYFPKEQNIFSPSELLSLIHTCPTSERLSFFKEMRCEDGYEALPSLSFYKALASSVEDKSELMTLLFKSEKFTKSFPADESYSYFFLFFSLYFPEDLETLQQVTNRENLFPELKEQKRELSTLVEDFRKGLQNKEKADLLSAFITLLNTGNEIEKGGDRSGTSPIIEFCKELSKNSNEQLSFKEVVSVFLECPEDFRASLLDAFPIPDPSKILDYYQLISPSAKEQKSVMKQLFCREEYRSYLIADLKEHLTELLFVLSDEELDILGELFTETGLFESKEFSEMVKELDLSISSLKAQFSSIRSVIEADVLSEIKNDQFTSFDPKTKENIIFTAVMIMIRNINYSSSDSYLQEMLSLIFDSEKLTSVEQKFSLRMMVLYSPMMKDMQTLDSYLDHLENYFLKQIKAEENKSDFFALFQKFDPDQYFPLLANPQIATDFYAVLIQKFKAWHDKSEEKSDTKTPFLTYFSLKEWNNVKIKILSSEYTLDLLDLFEPYLDEFTEPQQMIDFIRSISSLIKKGHPFSEELFAHTNFQKLLEKVSIGDLLDIWNLIKDSTLFSAQDRSLNSPAMRQWFQEGDLANIFTEVIYPLSSHEEALSLITSVLTQLRENKNVKIALFIDMIFIRDEKGYTLYDRLKGFDEFSDEMLPKFTITTREKTNLLEEHKENDAIVQYINSLPIEQ